MRKYENVDIIASLGAVMELNTEHYKSDFSYDIKMFMEAAQHPTEENTHLLWLSRHCGTECFRERDAYLKESQASHTWTFHATTGDSILAYAVEITGLQDGKVMGNLYELDYRQHAAKLGQQALPIQEVSLKFEDGTEGRYPYEQYNHGIYGMVAEHGKLVSRHYEPESEGALRGLLTAARQSRQKNRAATFKIKIGRKPSIRKQLAAAKSAAAPKKAPAQKKSRIGGRIMVHFTVEEENLVCVYYKADRRRTMGRMTAALPDMDGDMQALARQTIRKLEAMTDADFEDMRFLFTDE